MVEAIASLIESRAWKALEVHAAVNRNLHLRDIFAQDPKRGVRLKVEAVGIYLDYSKNRIIDETVALLLQLAVESSLHSRIDAMFRGERSTSRRSGQFCMFPCALLKRRRSSPRE